MGLGLRIRELIGLRVLRFRVVGLRVEDSRAYRALGFRV